MPRNFDSNFDRFKPEHKGGHHAQTTFEPSSFRISNNKSYKLKKTLQGEPIGRPLWKRELSKESPAPDVYKIQREFDPNKYRT